MQIRPTAIELLRGVEAFLSEEAVPLLDGPAQFHARVAANAVRIVVRGLEAEAGDLRAEGEALAALLGRTEPMPADGEALRREVAGMNQRLAEMIRAGEADAEPTRGRLIEHLKAVTLRALEVNNPKMAEAIRRQWGEPSG